MEEKQINTEEMAMELVKPALIEADMSTNISELAKALCKAQSELEPASKDSQNPFYKNKYADLATMQDVSRKPLCDNGLIVTQLPFTRGKCVGVKTILLHTSGQWIKATLSFEMQKTDPQSCGSAITYARRYSLAAIVGIAQEDDDGEKAMNRSKKEAPKASSTSKIPKADLTTKQLIIESAKTRFASSDDFKLFRVDGGLVEDLNKASEPELKKLLEQVEKRGTLYAP